MDGQNYSEWSLNAGAFPPVADAPVSPTVLAERDNLVAEATNAHNRTHRLRNATLGLGLVAGALLGGNQVMSRTGNEAAPTSISAPGENGEGSVDVEICPDGMFPEGAYEATIKAFGNSELHQRPDGELNVSSNADVVDYLLGDAPGVACRSALTEAGLSALYADMAGAGNAGTGFEVTDINSLAQTYKNDTEKAKRDSPILAAAYAKGKPNEEQITGPYFRLGTAEELDAEGNPTAEYIPESVDVAPGDVYVVTYADIINDGDTDVANRDQKVLIDENGQLYALKAVGAPVREEQKPDADGNTGGGSGENEGENGGDESQEHDGQDNGCDNGCGDENGNQPKPGSGEGGDCGNKGCGGGTGGDCGCTTTPPATGGPQPTTPTTVYVPPTTPYTPPVVTQPPSTQPPVTQPPVTTPPTTKPKGSEPTTPGAPNGVEVQIVDGQAYVTVHRN